MSKWQMYQISEFGEIVTGSTPFTSNNLFWNGNYNFYSPADFSDSVYCYKTGKTLSLLGLNQGREIPKDSILVTCIASIGKIAINGKSGITNQQINTIVINDRFDFKYIYYLLVHNSHKIKGIAAQTTIPIVNKTDFGKIQILALSDKTDQQKISHILSTCDTVIEQTQAAIAKYKAIKQGMLHDLFTRGLDANGKLRLRYKDAPELYKESELGMIPKEWDVKRLEEISTMKSGDGITSQYISDTGDFPVYGGNGLRGFTTTFTHEGDYVLIGRQGALCGNVTRVSNKFFASEHAVVATVNKDIDVDWLSQKLDDMNLNQYSEASAQPGLAVAKILRLLITKPQHDEQREIGKRLLALDNKLRSEETLLQKYQSIKSGLMSDLLGGKKEVINQNALTCQ